MKTCIKCQLLKDFTRFPKDSRLKSGYRNVCKDCLNVRFLQWKTKSGFLEYQKQHRLANYEALSISQKECRYRNKDKYNARTRAKRKSDINFKIRQTLRNRISYALKRKKKAGSHISDLGCTVDYLKQYLESKFQPGMKLRL